MKRLALIVLLAGGLCAAALGQTHARTAAAAVPDFTAQGTVNGLNAAVTVTTDQGMVYVVVCDASQAQTEYDIKASNFEGRLHSKEATL